MSAADTTKTPTGLGLYTRAAEASSAQVIGAYSTSFGWATALLGSECRQPVKNIYALVRVADEIVDGAAAEAGVNGSPELDALEAETYRAMKSGFSTNLVVHAFAVTARAANIGEDLVRPFFHSMRMDLTEREHDQASFDTYVYGSAEVVGLMCLQVFVQNLKLSPEAKADLVAGARALGAAFQKVNFLRDLAADFKRLGRSYFPGVNIASFDEATKVRLVKDIRADLETSAACLRKLPKSARGAVTAAQLLFAALNEQIARTPARVLIERRIRVSNPRKVAILLAAMIWGRLS